MASENVLVQLPGPAGAGQRRAAIAPYGDGAASRVAGDLDREVLGLPRQAAGLQA
jgi:hypothetical protein